MIPKKNSQKFSPKNKGDWRNQENYHKNRHLVSKLQHYRIYAKYIFFGKSKSENSKRYTLNNIPGEIEPNKIKKTFSLSN